MALKECDSNTNDPVSLTTHCILKNVPFPVEKKNQSEAIESIFKLVKSYYEFEDNIGKSDFHYKCHYFVYGY